MLRALTGGCGRERQDLVVGAGDAPCWRHCRAYSIVASELAGLDPKTSHFLATILLPSGFRPFLFPSSLLPFSLTLNHTRGKMVDILVLGATGQQTLRSLRVRGNHGHSSFLPSPSCPMLPSSVPPAISLRPRANRLHWSSRRSRSLQPSSTFLVLVRPRSARQDQGRRAEEVAWRR